MKRNLFIVLLTAGFFAITLSSYEHGPAYEGSMNRTGSIGGAANCAGSGCHGPNDPSTTVSISVKNSAGATVTSYAPGATYTVTVNGHNSLSTALAKFGFQVSAVLPASSTQAGTFTAISGSNVRITPLSGLQIAEHKRPLDETSTNTYEVSFKWTAPAAGSGNVEFYGILNPVEDDGNKPAGGGVIVKKTTDDNNNNEDNDDDNNDDDELGLSYPNIAPTVTLTEGTGTNGVTTTANAFGVSCYPNPCASMLHITVSQADQDCKAMLYDLTGKMVMAASLTSHGNTANEDVNTSTLIPGVYTLRVSNGQTTTNTTIVKK